MSSPTWLEGVFPALVTPFERADESLDESAFRHLIQFCLPACDGLVTGGTTGEFHTLSRQERKRLVEIAVGEAEGKPVIAGSGASGTTEAIDIAIDAQDAGASALLVVTPYFLHPSDKGVYQHYSQIAARVDLPIILYNIPQVVDRVLPRPVVEDLADIDNVVAIKDSSGDLTYTMEILEFVGDRIQVLIGHDEVVLPALAGGAAGMILASAQIYPEVWQAVKQFVNEGNLTAARNAQRQVQKLSRIFCRHGGGVAVKAALNAMGVRVGRPRAPLKAVGGALSHENRAEIRLELEKIGKIEPKPSDFAYPSGDLADRFSDLNVDAEMIESHLMKVGSGQSGKDINQVQIDIIAGAKSGPLGDAYAVQMTYPIHGREALAAILEPALTIRPATLIMPSLPQRDLRQANMIYGPVQLAISRAIANALADGEITRDDVDNQVMIASVTVHPKALDRHDIYLSALDAATQALQMVTSAVVGDLRTQEVA
ncbi:MAG: 4-hydroxy-tetrahydrodipicolinate synthase [Chloroflexota bacterium]